MNEQSVMCQGYLTFKLRNIKIAYLVIIDY